MLKKTLEYEDFDGNRRTEDHYFNLTEAEVTEMELSLNGGLSQLLDKILKENDQKQIIEYFKKIVLMTYGKKSLDGRQFIKNDEIRQEFASTAAYSEIFMELATDADAAAAFVNGVMPKKKAGKAVYSSGADYHALPGKAPVEGANPMNTN